jgi:hypothetical protein
MDVSLRRWVEGPSPFAGLARAFYRARLPLVFMHVPKTSGASIAHGLATALAPTILVSGFDRSLFDPGRNLTSIDDSIRCHIYTSPTSMPKNADLVAGHFAASTLIDAYPASQRCTVLREPFSRLLSHWLYWRQYADCDLAPWGDWAGLMRLSREPLAGFLSEPALACQIDNVTLRMLLWPHPLIAPTRFIYPVHDSRLLRDALVRLQKFDFVDIVENDTLVDNLRHWLGHPFNYGRVNETSVIPDQFRTSLQHELTPNAHELLYARSRLDLCIWSKVAARRLPHCDVVKLREQTILANVSRYSVLMACGNPNGERERAASLRKQ